MLALDDSIIYFNIEQCNGIRDCQSGSDERFCGCPEETPNPCSCRNASDVCVGNETCYTNDRKSIIIRFEIKYQTLK